MDSTNETTETTKEIIQKEAMKEFLKSGFNGASLRNIVKNVGLTTGAFYRYYPSKEALFADLVEEHANHLYQMFDNILNNFLEQDPEEQTENMTTTSRGGMARMIDYVYQHYDNFLLLLTAAEGTTYSNFITNLAEREAASTFQYMEVMREAGVPIPPIDEELVHLVSHGMFSGVFDIVLHNRDQKDAMKRIRQLGEFYSGGWERLFGIKFGEERKDG